MALIKCLECGKEISEQALSCPHCGCPIKSTLKVKKKDNYKVYAVISIIAFVLAGIMWFWRESHGVAIAESEYAYILLGYMDSTLMMARVVSIALPATIIVFIVFLVIGIIVKVKK